MVDSQSPLHPRSSHPVNLQDLIHIHHHYHHHSKSLHQCPFHHPPGKDALPLHRLLLPQILPLLPPERVEYLSDLHGGFRRLGSVWRDPHFPTLSQRSAHLFELDVRHYHWSTSLPSLPLLVQVASLGKMGEGSGEGLSDCRLMDHHLLTSPSSLPQLLFSSASDSYSNLVLRRLDILEREQVWPAFLMQIALQSGSSPLDPLCEHRSDQ